jgi:hypothetical protein
MKRIGQGEENGNTEGFSEIEQEILVRLPCLYAADVT